MRCLLPDIAHEVREPGSDVAIAPRWLPTHTSSATRAQETLHGRLRSTRAVCSQSHARQRITCATCFALSAASSCVLPTRLEA